MYTVKLLPKARFDISDACEWYEEKKAGLGKRFYSAVDSKLLNLENNALIYRVKFSKIYRAVKIRDFPYLIIYRVDQKAGLVYVISVFHTSKNPIDFRKDA